MSQGPQPRRVAPPRRPVPLVRGEDGEQRPVTWDAALADLATRIEAAIAEHGPDAVGVLLATGSAFDTNGRRTAERLWRVLGSRSKYTSGTIDTPCKPFVSRLMSGFPGLVPTLDPRTARLTMFLGCNPVVSHGHLNGLPDPIVTLRPLAEGDRELWVIDPRRTETGAPRHAARGAAPRHRPRAPRPPRARGAGRRRRPRVPRCPHRTRRRGGRRRPRRTVRPRGHRGALRRAGRRASTTWSRRSGVTAGCRRRPAPAPRCPGPPTSPSGCCGCCTSSPGRSTVRAGCGSTPATSALSTAGPSAPRVTSRPTGRPRARS